MLFGPELRRRNRSGGVRHGWGRLSGLQRWNLHERGLQQLHRPVSWLLFRIDLHPDRIASGLRRRRRGVRRL
jgi:hypothetical protein